MRLLIVAATSFEFYEFKSHYESMATEAFDNGLELDFLVCGVGLVPTVYNLLSHLKDHAGYYDGVIQMGIAGSFKERFPIGTIVKVESEAFGDAGAEDNDGSVLDLFEMNLWHAHESPFDNKLIFESHHFPHQFNNKIIKAHGLTVSLGSGQAHSIAIRKKKFAADIESMEGAAFFYVCQKENIPCRQIRCISNPVTPRDTAQWQIKKAIDDLNSFMIKEFLDL